MMKNDLLKNIDRLHTTEMGAGRITRNLGLEDEDPLEWCRTRITNQATAAERRGKNWYVRADGCVITVNASSFTIITAHKS